MAGAIDKPGQSYNHDTSEIIIGYHSFKNNLQKIITSGGVEITPGFDENSLPLAAKTELEEMRRFYRNSAQALGENLPRKLNLSLTVDDIALACIKGGIKSSYDVEDLCYRAGLNGGTAQVVTRYRKFKEEIEKKQDYST